MKRSSWHLALYAMFIVEATIILVAITFLVTTNELPDWLELIIRR
jgi:hypothetical protein